MQLTRASDRAYAQLREDILEWRLEPGTVLAEIEQAARLGVSRTPLREALSRLAADGLVAPQPGRGVVVTDVSLKEITSLFDARIPLDCAAAALAAGAGNRDAFEQLALRFESATPLIRGSNTGHSGYYELVAELDAAIDAAASNPYLLQAQRNLRTHLARVRRLARDDTARLTASAREHAQIASAIAHGNPDLAAAATKVHLHHSLQYLLAVRAGEPLHTREESHG